MLDLKGYVFYQFIYYKFSSRTNNKLSSIPKFLVSSTSKNELVLFGVFNNRFSII